MHTEGHWGPACAKRLQHDDNAPSLCDLAGINGEKMNIINSSSLNFEIYL